MYRRVNEVNAGETDSREGFNSIYFTTFSNVLYIIIPFHPDRGSTMAMSKTMYSLQ